MEEANKILFSYFTDILSVNLKQDNKSWWRKKKSAPQLVGKILPKKPKQIKMQFYLPFKSTSSCQLHILKIVVTLQEAQSAVHFHPGFKPFLWKMFSDKTISFCFRSMSLTSTDDSMDGLIFGTSPIPIRNNKLDGKLFSHIWKEGPMSFSWMSFAQNWLNNIFHKEFFPLKIGNYRLC